MIELRRSRKTYRQIARMLGLAVSTVVCLFRQAGLHRLAELKPAPVVERYEYPNPGDLLYLDIKKLGRFWRPGYRVTGDRQQNSGGAGWEFVHVAIDDASRLAFTSLHPDERGSSACRALLQVLRYYRGLGVRLRQVMTDNGACYRSGACAAAWDCGTSARNPIRHAPTARPSALSRRACASEPTPGAMNALSRDPLTWQIVARRSTYRQHGKRSLLYRVKRRIEKVKVQVRAKVEHPFRVIKRQFGYIRVLFRGLAKNTS